MEKKIIFRDVCKAYDKNAPVIEDLNLSIEEGSFTVLLGPSGCGKSTTLRMIAGLEKETKGTVLMDGMDMKDVKPGDREIAFVFQNYALYPSMTVKENIEFGLKNNRVPRDEREKRIREVSSSVGLDEYLNRKPSALSGGQRQRVALARAMVKNPKVFLMDEPLSNLDAKLRAQIRTDLIELHKNIGSTFVYVTHDQTEAMSMGTDIVLMNKGRIMQQGTPYEIYYDPANVFTAQFIGTPPMNIIKADQVENFRIPKENAAFLGFRPEYVEFAEDVTSDDLYMSGKVITAEMLGTEILYKVETQYGRVNVKKFSSRKNGSEDVLLRIPVDSILYFDANEDRIR